jgi:hypothetical protein
MMQLVSRQLKIQPLIQVTASLSPKKAMSEIFVTFGVLVVACLSLLAMSMRTEQAGAPLQNSPITSKAEVNPKEAGLSSSSPSSIADLPPDDDKGAPGRRGGNRGQRGNMG